MNNIVFTYSKASAVERVHRVALALEEYVRTEGWVDREDELKQVTGVLDLLYAQIDMVFRGSAGSEG